MVFFIDVLLMVSPLILPYLERIAVALLFLNFSIEMSVLDKSITKLAK